MKKYDRSYLTKTVRHITAAWLIIGVLNAVRVLASAPDTDFIPQMHARLFLVIPAVTCVIPWILFSIVSFFILKTWGHFSKHAVRTMEKGLVKHDFADPYVLKSSGENFAIDSKDGRVAYVSNYAPYDFQCAAACDLCSIKADYARSLSGGIGGVYFSFIHQGQETRIHTFISNRSYSRNNPRIVSGMEKANMYVALLTKAAAGEQLD